MEGVNKGGLLVRFNSLIGFLPFPELGPSHACKGTSDFHLCYMYRTVLVCYINKHKTDVRKQFSLGFPAVITCSCMGTHVTEISDGISIYTVFYGPMYDSYLFPVRASV